MCCSLLISGGGGHWSVSARHLGASEHGGRDERAGTQVEAHDGDVTAGGGRDEPDVETEEGWCFEGLALSFLSPKKSANGAL